MATQTSAVAVGSGSTSGLDVPWVNDANARTANDTYATVTLDNGIGGPESEKLFVYDFGFTIPTTATINGIEVTWFRKCDGGEIKDFQAFLWVGGASGNNTGTDHADTGTFWPTTEGSAVYGSPTDKWDNTITASSINDSGFGVCLSAQFVGALTDTGYVDNASITVHYTPATPAAEMPLHTQPVLKQRRSKRIMSF